MSWSVSATGKAPAVAIAIEKQFAGMASYPCPEPEETAKQRVREAIAAILGGHTADGLSVKVTASGSMSWSGGDQHKPEKVHNFLRLEVESFAHLE